MSSHECHTGHTWQGLASRAAVLSVWDMAMNCPVQVAAGSEVGMVSQNALPSEEPTAPNGRQHGKLLEET